MCLDYIVIQKLTLFLKVQEKLTTFNPHRFYIELDGSEG